MYNEKKFRQGLENNNNSITEYLKKHSIDSKIIPKFYKIMSSNLSTTFCLITLKQPSFKMKVMEAFRYLKNKITSKEGLVVVVCIIGIAYYIYRDIKGWIGNPLPLDDENNDDTENKSCNSTINKINEDKYEYFEKMKKQNLYQIFNNISISITPEVIVNNNEIENNNLSQNEKEQIMEIFNKNEHELEVSIILNNNNYNNNNDIINCSIINNSNEMMKQKIIELEQENTKLKKKLTSLKNELPELSMSLSINRNRARTLNLSSLSSSVVKLNNNSNSY
jgi:hypothetical protein